MKKVITYGTFDLFHVGHRNILKRAKALGDHLIVAVTSENFDLERGKLNVRDNLLTRIENVRTSGFADEIIVEEYLGQKVNDILKYGVDVFVVGSDWIGKFDYLKKYCEVIYLERTKDISSTQLREADKIFRIDIMTDSDDDADMISESKFVSGLEVSEEDADIVFVHTAIERRYSDAKQALQHGQHLILDFPTANSDQLEDLYRIAADQNLSVRVRVPLAYLRTFHQLVWLLHSGVIGDVRDIVCSIPEADAPEDSAAIVAFASDRLSGGAAIDLQGSAEAGMTITGADGRIVVPGKWQCMSYFRVERDDADTPKHYSFNIEGSGFRYILSEMLSSIRENRRESGMFPQGEALKVIGQLEKAGILAGGKV
jgi:glycerol-3-phosphate cytidylyltransferase